MRGWSVMRERTERITCAVPSVVRSLLYRFLKVPSSHRRSVTLCLSHSGASTVRAQSLDRRPPGAAGAVAGLGLR